MKHFLHIILILFLFILSQFAAAIVALIMMGIDLTAVGTPQFTIDDIDPLVEGRAILAVDIVLVGILWLARLAGRNIFSAPKTLTPVATVLGIVGMLVLAHGIEFMATPLGLDDFGTTAQFMEMSSDWLCVLAICVVIPMTEEMVFRAGVLRKMIEGGCGKWVAIVTTAVAFGVFHGNPLQAIPAMIMGIALGWLYTKTNSLRLCLLAHVANNSLACIEMQFPQLDAYTTNSPTVSIVLLGVCLAYFGIRLLTSALKKVSADEPVAKPAAPATTE